MPIINQIVKGGGTTPTGTIQITTNGITDVTNYANADVQVPTTAPAHYIKCKNDQGHLVKDGSVMVDCSGITNIAPFSLYYAYYFAEITAGVGETYFKPFPNANNLSLEQSCAVHIFDNAYFNNPNVSFDGVVELGETALMAAFSESNVEKIYFPDLTYADTSAFGSTNSTYAFRLCSSLTEIHFPAAIQADIQAITGYSAKWGASSATIYFDL